MSISELKNKNRKVVTLPESEIELTIRKMNIADIAEIKMPLRYLIEGIDFESIDTPEKDIASRNFVEAAKLAVIRATIQEEDGTKFVDKIPQDCEEKEVSVYDLSFNDFLSLWSDIQNFSFAGADKASEESTFRDGAGTDIAPVSEDIQSAPEPIIESKS